MNIRKTVVLFLSLTFCLVVLRCSQMSSPDINDNQYSIFLTGRILDKDGKPMPNSIASLVRRNISDTTDADGYYQIVEKTANSSLIKTLAADTLDSLQIIKEGQVITILDITKWIDTLPDVFVIQRDIYGDFASKPDSLCIIEAVITGDNISDSFPKTAELWYNAPNQSYSGFVYFVYTADLLHYSVYVNVYNKDSSFVGRSAKVDFPSNAGNINIPTFNPKNGQPIVDAGNDTIVSINDTIRLYATAVDSFGGKIAKWEWSINGGNFDRTSTGDTMIIAPADSNPAYQCVVRAMDNDGQVATDILSITICKDVPSANAGADTTLKMNSPYILHGKASQNFGSIVKWEWSIGNSGFKQTSLSDTTITTPDSIVSEYPCILRVTDDDGNICTDTINIVVGMWEYVGLPGFSIFPIYSVSLAMADSIPYVFYTNIDTSQYPAVMKYDGNAWVLVGSSSISSGSAGFASIALFNGVPYVAYSDGSKGGKATVMKYNGNSWVTVGNAGFSAGNSTYLSFALSDSIPYVAYGDGAKSNKATAMKYDGNSWVTVGNAGFSSGSAGYTSLAVFNGKPYIVYNDGANGGKAKVMNFDGSSWVSLGSQGFTATDIHSPSIVINNGIPYIAFRDNGNGGRATAMKYDGGAWIYVGTPGFSIGQVSSTFLAIYNSLLFIAYHDDSNGADVQSYNGTIWKSIGTLGNNVNIVGSLSLAIYNGVPYIAFCDRNNNNKASVMCFR